MKNISTLAGLCCLALCFVAVIAEAAEKPELTRLRQDSGKNYSDMNLTFFSSYETFGSLSIGEAVKFTAPKSGWKLQAVRVVGWSEYNESTQTYPRDRNIMIEVRDSDFNLLYKFADAQNNYFLSPSGKIGEIEIPALSVTGDFYVVFYDRGAAGIGVEQSESSGNSFIFIGGDMVPPESVFEDTNETIKINWLIEAAGN